MNCLLKVSIAFALVPHCRTAGLTSLTNQNVAATQGEFIQLRILESHLENLREIEIEPTHVHVAKIATWRTFVLCFVQHLAEPAIRDVADTCPGPGHGYLIRRVFRRLMIQMSGCESVLRILRN